MVRRGSGVRVPSSALHGSPATAGYSSSGRTAHRREGALGRNGWGKCSQNTRHSEPPKQVRRVGSRPGPHRRLVHRQARHPAIRSAEHGYLVDERGQFRRIDVRGAAATRPGAINNRGQIAGEFVDRASSSHGYLQDSDGSVTTIDPPGAGATVITDVDDRGRVVGAFVDTKQTAIGAFVREPDGRFTTIAHPDAGFYGTLSRASTTTARSPAPTVTPTTDDTASCSTTAPTPPSTPGGRVRGFRRPLRRGHHDRRPRRGPDPRPRHQQPRPDRHRHR